MARLSLELDAHRVFAGDTAFIELLLGDAPVTGRVLLTAVARFGFRVGLSTPAYAAGQNRITERTIASHAVEITGATAVPWSFTIPADLPPTHDAFGIAFCQVAIDAIVDTGDSRVEETFPLTIDLRAHDVATLPATAASPTAVHRLELAVATSRLGIGDTIAGLCAAPGMKDHRPRVVRLAVEGLLVIDQARGQLIPDWNRPIEIRRVAIDHQIVLPVGIGDAAVPFAIALPQTLAPTLAITGHRLDWRLTGSTDAYFFEGPAQVEIPLELVAPNQVARTTVPPSLGAPDVVAICERLAESRDWYVDPAIVTDADLGTIYPRLAIDAEPIRIWVGIAHRDGGIAIVSHISYRPLELGLEVLRSSRLRSLFSPRDLESGDDEWDRKHRVHARDADGAVGVLRAIVPLLSRVGAVVRWTDAELITEQPAGGGVEPNVLADVVDGARAIGRALEGMATRHEGPYR